MRASGPASEQAGYTEGHAAGYAAGVRAAAKEQRRWRDRMTAEHAATLASGQQDLDRAVRALAVARTDFAHRNVQALHDAEEVLARTALELAEAILGYELAEGTRTARAALDRALSGNDAATVLAIRLHPGDIEVLAKEGQDLPAGPAAARGPVAQPRRRRQGRIPAGLARREPRQRPGTRPRGAAGRRGIAGRESDGGPAMIAEWRPKGADYASALRAAAPQRVGVVTSVMGLGLEVSGLDCALGDLVTVGSDPGLDAEVVAALDSSVRCMPLGRLAGVAAGDPVRAKGGTVLVPTGPGLFGRVVDGLGKPIDGKGPLNAAPACRSTATPPTP